MATKNTPFSLSDGFNFAELCNAVNDVAVSLGPVSRSGLFKDKPLISTDIALEILDNQLHLVQNSLRGGVVKPSPITNRSLVKFSTAHLKTNAVLMADAWLNRQGFNTGMPAFIESEKMRILGEHRHDLEASIDFMKTRALAGQVLDAAGNVIVDLHAEFGIVQHVVDCTLDVATTNVANKLIAARRLAEAELGAAFASEWTCFASLEFLDAMRSHASIEAGLAGWSAASTMLADIRSGELVVSGIKFVEVGNRAGATFITAGDAYLCAEGVNDLFVCGFGPGDYVEAVGMEALPIYAKSEELAMGRGLTIESQSNPMPWCSRPKSVIKLSA